MLLINVKDYEQLSKESAAICFNTMKENPYAQICLATGGSVKRMYEILAKEINDKQLDISNITFIKLDEWCGVSLDDACTCSYYLHHYFFDLLHQKPTTFIEFKSDAFDVNEEVKRINEHLQQQPIDLMILGLGMDGHLGLNEPNDVLTLPCHESALHDKTMTHDMIKERHITSGVTIGMQGIFQAKQILMLITGANKEDAYQAFMQQQLTTQNPSSFLWIHPNCISIIDDSQFY